MSIGINQILFAVCLLITLPLQAAQQAAEHMYATRYDIAGRVVATISPDPDGSGPLSHIATRYTYSGTAGLLEKTEKGFLVNWQAEDVAPSGWQNFIVSSTIKYFYDSYGRKATEKIYGTNLAMPISMVQYTYDSYHRMQCKIVRMNPDVFNVLSDTAPLCAQSIYVAPSAAGLFGLDRITRYTYEDTYGMITKEERGFGTSLSQAYVVNTYLTGTANLETQTDANGNKTTLSYDPVTRRLQRINYPSVAKGSGVSASNDYVEFNYDDNGNKTWERKRNGVTITYTIDANDRVVFKDYSNNLNQKDISYVYDLRGLLLSSRFLSDSGKGITNNYDGFGRLRSSINDMGSIARTLTYDYDLNGNRKYIRHPDGQYFSYSYDQLDRVTGVSENLVPGNSLLTVSYNSGGKRDVISRAIVGGKTTYTYPNGVQLQSFTQSFATTANNLTNAFKYNPVGQITSLTQSNSQYRYIGDNDRVGVYTPNGLNQYTHIANQPMDHDLNGNMINDGFSSYTFDDENRLLTASSAGLTAKLSYDPNGRLFQTVINGETREYLYDGDALVAEYVGGTMQRRYVHGDQVDEPWVQYEGSSVNAEGRRYLHANHQGSIIAHSNINGSVVNTLAYDAYGIPASMNVGTFAYTGQIYLKALNLYYYKARIYSPRIGRFLQTDPIGYKDDYNLYAYVGNDPVNKIDPTGMYGRGTGWTDDQWKRFDKIQQRAAGRMEKTASKMEAKAAKLDAKGKPGSDALRAKAGYLNAGAEALRSNGSDGKFADAVDTATYANCYKGTSEGGAAFVQGNGPIMVVNIGNTNAWGRNAGTTSERAVGHESLHTAGLNDQKINGIRAYWDGPKPTRDAFEKMKGTPQADINPDHLMDEVY